MSKPVKHIKGPRCLLCEEKLKQAHSILQEAFVAIKAKFPNCHISCTYRDKAAQDIAFHTGHSRLQWPSSAHNTLPSKAFDLFCLRDDFVPEWRKEYFKQIADFLTEAKIEIFWGGRWGSSSSRSFSDPPHFQIALDRES